MTGKIQGNRPIYFRYYEGTPQESRDAIKDTVVDFLKKTGYNAEFLRGTTFSAVDKYGNLSTSSPFLSYLQKHGDKDHPLTHGCTIYPEINDNKKEIVIKTEEYEFPQSIWRKSLKPNILKQGVMHEIGHMFDDYYGTKNARTSANVKKIRISDNLTPRETQLLKDYEKHKDLSDNRDFKDAWKKDVENLGKDKKKLEKFKTGGITSYYFPTGIDITDGINEKEIEDSDKARSEIFAQLFGYAFGKDDGHKQEILDTYPNTYKVVKKYIHKYLGVDCDNVHAHLAFLY